MTEPTKSRLTEPASEMTVGARSALQQPPGPDATGRTQRQAKTAGYTRLGEKIDLMWSRVEAAQACGLYHYFQPIDEVDGCWVSVAGERKLMFATYNYLDLIRHPRIIAASQTAAAQYGVGSQGSRILGGTLDLHSRLEQRIAKFTGREDAIAYSSGYVTNLATISTIVGRGDWVFADKWDHASIVDGCLLAQGEFRRFRHNDMASLERALKQAPPQAGKLVLADAVFSMDGDIFDLPSAVGLTREYGALLMIDEAHSTGVLGNTGRGIEEHFGMPGAVDIWMGTLSKAIPGIGGYVAGDRKLITFLRHTARGFVFSSAPPPSVTAATLAAFDVLDDEGEERVRLLRRNAEFLIAGLRKAGFDTGQSCTPIVPIIVGTEERALATTTFCQNNGVFVLPALPPAVPEGTARLRANVTAAHTLDDLAFALDVFTRAGKAAGVI